MLEVSDSECVMIINRMAGKTIYFLYLIIIFVICVYVGAVSTVILFEKIQNNSAVNSNGYARVNSRNCTPAPIKYFLGDFSSNGCEIFYNNGAVNGADAGTFEIILGGYAKDKNWVYLGRDKISDRPNSFKILDGFYYAKDEANVYYEGNLLVADPKTFKVDEQYPDLYGRDQDHIWREDDLIEGADLASFKIIDGFYSKDKNFVYHSDQKIRSTKEKLSEVLPYDEQTSQNEMISADPATFKVLGPAYSADKNYIYYGSSLLRNADRRGFEDLTKDEGGSGIYVVGAYGKDGRKVFRGDYMLTNADSKTFEVLSSSYQRDKNNLYHYGRAVAYPDLDPPSFQLLEGPYAKDKNQAYWLLELNNAAGMNAIKGVDVETFIALDSFYSKDIRAVYYNLGMGNAGASQAVIVGALPKSFFLLKDGFAKDAEHIYCIGMELTGVSTTTFTVLSNAYSRDAATVYYGCAPLVGADPSTFEILGSGYARDMDAVYRDGKRLAGINPAKFRAFDSAYFTDGEKVYYVDHVVDGADFATFAIAEKHYMKDKNSLYLFGKKIYDADPNDPRPCAGAFKVEYCK